MVSLKKIKSAKGTILPPGDKSISHRAIMLCALANGESKIKGFLMGADCLSTIDCFSKLGIKTEIEDEVVRVYGKGLFGLSKPCETLYAGNSGTTTRLLTGLLSGQDFDSVITGDESIQKRPMKRITAPLSKMGALIEGEFCPLNIKGQKLKGIEYEMEVASAQVKTSLLLAGLFADGKTTIKEKEKSRDHTERMLFAMGADIKVDDKVITLSPGKELSPLDITIPADISSAAFFMVLGAIMPEAEILIKNVGTNPTRAGIIEVMRKMGADITLLNERVSGGEEVADILVKTSKLTGIEISGDIIPRLIDEIPIIAVLAAFAKGETIIADAKELKVKETNRIDAVVTELKKCGIDIVATDDGMIIRGCEKIKGASFKGYGDHRMIMSLAVLSQMTDEECFIDETESVKISYPDFFDDLYSL